MMTLIAHAELGSNANNIDLTNIPAGFKGIRVVLRGRNTNSSGWYPAYWRVNGTTIGGNTAAFEQNRNYAAGGAGSGASRDGYGIEVNGASSSVDTFSNAEATIFGYDRTDIYKVMWMEFASESFSTNALVQVAQGIFKNNAAVTSIGFNGVAGNFVAGTTVTVYGLA